MTLLGACGRQLRRVKDQVRAESSAPGAARVPVYQNGRGLQVTYIRRRALRHSAVSFDTLPSWVQGVLQELPKSKNVRLFRAVAYIGILQPKWDGPSLNSQNCSHCDGPLFEVNAFDNIINEFYGIFHEAYMIHDASESDFDSAGDEMEKEDGIQ